MQDPDTLNLSKEEIHKRIVKIENNILSTQEGKLKSVKFKLVFGFLKWLVDHYDNDVLNKIFLGIINEFDDMRYENALNSGDNMMEILKKIREEDKKKKNDWHYN